MVLASYRIDGSRKAPTTALCRIVYFCPGRFRFFKTTGTFALILVFSSGFAFFHRFFRQSLHNGRLFYNDLLRFWAVKKVDIRERIWYYLVEKSVPHMKRKTGSRTQEEREPIMKRNISLSNYYSGQRSFPSSSGFCKRNCFQRKLWRRPYTGAEYEKRCFPYLREWRHWSV